MTIFIRAITVLHRSRCWCRCRCHHSPAQPLIVYHLQRIYGALSFSYLFASHLHTTIYLCTFPLIVFFGVMHFQRQLFTTQPTTAWHPEWKLNKTKQKKKTMTTNSQKVGGTDMRVNAQWRVKPPRSRVRACVHETTNLLMCVHNFLGKY